MCKVGLWTVWLCLHPLPHHPRRQFLSKYPFLKLISVAAWGGNVFQRLAIAAILQDWNHNCHKIRYIPCNSMTVWGGMGFSSTSFIKRRKANPIYWALFNIDNDQMTTGKYLIKYLIACCNQNICWNMRKNAPSPPLIDNDQTRLQWSSLQWRNWTQLQSGSNYLSFKLTELSSTMVFFFCRWWMLRVRRMELGGLELPSLASASSSPSGWGSCPSSSVEVPYRTKKGAYSCTATETNECPIWPTSYTQISQSAPTPPTLTLWTMGTGFSTARFTLSGTAQFSMVLRSLIGKASTMGKVVLHIFYVRSDQLNSHQFYV